MAVVEYGGKVIKVIRCNRSYREFVARYFNVDSVGKDDTVENVRKNRGSEIVAAMEACVEDGNRMFLDEKLDDGSVIHSMIKKLAMNPVNGISAYAVVVFDITQEGERSQ